MDFLSGNGESAHAESGYGAAPGVRSGGALPGQISHHGGAAIRWEKMLDVISTEPGNVT
jgi:hypothetical protein